MTHEAPPRGGISIRPIAEDELEVWTRTLDAAFLLDIAEGELELRRSVFLPGRSLGAFDGGRCVATFRTMDLELTVPGGRIVPMEGVTNVGVLPAYRRRGLLTTMMRRALEEAVGRGRALAGLIAAEYRIYGRFGFGPGTRMATYDIDVRRAGGVPLPGSVRGAVEPATMEEILVHGPEVHEAFRRTQVGAIDRRKILWRLRTGDVRNPHRPTLPDPSGVLYRDDKGAPAGWALYRTEEKWQDGDPAYGLTVEELVAARPSAAAAMWSHLLAIDWVTQLTVSKIGLDDPLRLLLANPRACTPRPTSGNDHLWLRLLDLPGALEARTYEDAGSLVLEVTDSFGHGPSRIRLEAEADGSANVEATEDEADLSLEAPALAQIYLGDRTFHALAASALVTEHRPGAVRRADRMFRTPERPWCLDGF